MPADFGLGIGSLERSHVPFALTPLFPPPISARRIFLLSFFAVKRLLGIFAILLLFSARSAARHSAQQPAPPQQPPSAPQAQPAQAPAPATTQSPQVPAVAPVPAPPPAPVERKFVVVLDPAHGGTDPGARGTGDAVEKDMVLIIARVVRLDLERQGYRVVMTRDNDQNPSFEDRAATANARRGAIFISFHISSTGAVGTARVYSYEFPSPPPVGPSDRLLQPPQCRRLFRLGGRSWNVAQKSYSDLSRRFADVLQVELSQRFKGSPEISSAVAVRGLRSIAEPAVAVELSSVAVEDPKTVEGMASNLAAAIVRAVGGLPAGLRRGQVMSRRLKIISAILVVAVIGGLCMCGFCVAGWCVWRSRPSLAEEQARREVVEPPITTPSDVAAKAKIFWISPTYPARLDPVEVQMPLSADPVQRARQVLHQLIANPPTAEQRTLPAGTTMLDFYILPDGTAIADFSDALANETPSGILSEQQAVDSIVRTLEFNVPPLHRLKILIHGQEAETLAGHMDLTGFFDLNPPDPQTPSKASATEPASAPPAAKPTGNAAGGLTGPGVPVKLKP